LRLPPPSLARSKKAACKKQAPRLQEARQKEHKSFSLPHESNELNKKQGMCQAHPLLMNMNV